MVKGLYQAASAMHAKMRDIELTANNLVNINTIGYKRQLPFSEVMARYQKKQITDFSEGDFSHTGDPLDMAISKNGFFMIQTDNGVQLTKNGHFQLTEEGAIVDSKGNKVLTAGGDLSLYDYILDKKSDFKISDEGEIKVGGEVIDRIMIAKIDDPSQMKRINGQYFAFPNGGYSIAQDDEYKIQQGYLENSNTNAISEMEQMISINKEYETAQRIVKMMDRRMGMVKEIGKV